MEREREERWREREREGEAEGERGGHGFVLLLRGVRLLVVSGCRGLRYRYVVGPQAFARRLNSEKTPSLKYGTLLV